MLGTEMDLSAAPDAPPVEADWLRVAERIEEAEKRLADDPLDGLAELKAAEEEARTLADRALEHGVRWARSAGKSWTEIAQVMGVARQAAWRRFTDRGIR